MIEFLSLLISAGGVLLTVLLEWPKIKERIPGSKEETQAVIAVSSQNEMQSSNLRDHKSSFSKTIVSIFVAIFCGLVFATIFIPFRNNSIVGGSVVVFLLLCVFWAFRYLRYKSWSFIKKLFVSGVIAYLVIVAILGIFGHIDT